MTNSKAVPEVVDFIKAAEAKAKENAELDLGLHQKYANPSPDSPVRTAVALERVGNYFATVTYKIQGKNVLEVTVDEPSSRAIAADCLKIAVQKTFLD